MTNVELETCKEFGRLNRISICRMLSYLMQIPRFGLFCFFFSQRLIRIVCFIRTASLILLAPYSLASTNLSEVKCSYIQLF